MTDLQSGGEVRGYCRNCGTPLTAETAREVRGILYCEPCLAAMVAKPQTAESPRSPALAAILAIIPGLGAVYTAEYAKALTYVLTFAVLVGIQSSNISGGGHAFVGIVMAAFFVFMIVDAYRSAKAINEGKKPPVEIGKITTDKPIGPLILIALGAIFLVQELTNFDVFEVVFEKGWPLILIGLGIWLLMRRQQQQQKSS